MEFQRITPCFSNGCEVDQVDGRDVEDGEPLEILWPDGLVDIRDVAMERSCRVISDEGRSVEVSVWKAWVCVESNRGIVPIRLDGSRLKVRRPFR